MNSFVNFFKKYLIQDPSPERLALAACVGNFIAFSPFLGLHTAMVFFCAWAFRLNFPIMLAVSMAINNPWTLVPVYLSDYIFGYWLSYSVFKFNFCYLNALIMQFVNVMPVFVAHVLESAIQYINYSFEVTFGLPKPCIWSFLIGGNILGLVTSLMLYPIIRGLFAKLARELEVPKAL